MSAAAATAAVVVVREGAAAAATVAREQDDEDYKDQKTVVATPAEVHRCSSFLRGLKARVALRFQYILCHTVECVLPGSISGFTCRRGIRRSTKTLTKRFFYKIKIIRKNKISTGFHGKSEDFQ